MRSRLALTLAGVVAFATSACSDSSEPAEPVATVLVSGVPSGPVLVGSSVQLSATALNATGGTISGATFTWGTSDPSLATVSSGGLVTALAIGEVTITASTGGKSGTAELELRGGGTLGPAGGTLTVENGALVLTVPAGSMPLDVDLRVDRAHDQVANGQLVPGTLYEITPLTFFNLGATLAIKYDPTRLPGGVTENSLQLYAFIPSANAWKLVLGSSVNAAARTVTGGIMATGTYAVAGTPVDHVTRAGPLIGGALYSGQTTTITATCHDANGGPLVGRSVTWLSSDPGRATVAGGVVTGVSAGAVTITANCEGAAASTSVLVLTRPVSDWSQVTSDWVTYQGNASHTGFVPATVDPVLFTTRWEKVIVTTGGGLNPVTFAPGRALVTTQTHFGSQRALSLDLSSGQQQWSRDLGSIAGVHQPAVAGDLMYFTTSGHDDSFLYALEIGTGAIHFKSPYANQWSLFYAPVIVDGKLYMAGNELEGMYSFDALSGAKRWFAATNYYDQWSPAVRDNTVYAYTGEALSGAGDARLIAVDAATGAVKYTIADPGFVWSGWSMYSAPVLGNNDLFITEGLQRLIAFDLVGKQIKYEMTGLHGSVVTDNTVFYVASLEAVEARRASDGALLWSWDVPGQGDKQVFSLLLTKNILFASTVDRTYAIDLESHRQVWVTNAGSQLTLSSQGVLAIAGFGGNLTTITVR